MTEQKRTTALYTSVGADEGQSLTNNKTIIPQESILDNPAHKIFPEGAGPQSLASLPEEVCKNGRFCCWRYEERNGKPTKVPYHPLTSERARSNATDSFCSFEEATAAKGYDGLGIGIFNGMCAIDLDNCIVDGEYTAKNNLYQIKSRRIKCSKQKSLEIDLTRRVGVNIEPPKALHLQGLIVTSNYFVLCRSRERCDRKGHAVFLRP